MNDVPLTASYLRLFPTHSISWIMTTLLQRRRHAHFVLAAVVSALAAMAVTLYRFSPESYGFYPQCPFHALTGLLCPGCGATRAVAALVHGNLAEAMRWNGLVVVLLPVGAAYGAWKYLQAVAGKPVVALEISNTAMFGMLGLALLFGIGRNLFGTALSF